MKTKTIPLAILLLSITGRLMAGPAAQMSSETLEKRAQEAIAASAKAHQELGQKFLPKPEALGTGWYLPWQLPPALRKCSSENEFWQSSAGSFAKDNKALLAALISLFLEFNPQELAAFLDLWVSLAGQDVPAGQLPEGLSLQQYALAPILLLLGWEFSPSLAAKMDLLAGFLEESQKIMAQAAEARFGTGKKAGSTAVSSEGEMMKELLSRSVKGRPQEKLKQEIMAWAASVKDMTGMTYSQCDNWVALQTTDETAFRSLHFRNVVVTLTIFDRNKMGEVISDLTPKQAVDLQLKLNARLGQFRNFSIEVMGRQQKAELEKKLAEEKDPARLKEIQAGLARMPEFLAQLQKDLPKVDIEVTTRDFGDNCYVINMKGDFKLPEFTLPATNLQACLRNGNAVVLIGLGGNHTPEQLKKELDLFLSEMDARTAFFRQ